MAFLKSLINRIFSHEEPNQADPDDHYYRLERLRTNHDWIGVEVAKSGQCYQSLILEIDVDNGELIIDDLYPPEGLEDLETGDTVEVTSQSRRVLVNFYTRILAREFKDGKASYRLELPEEVGRNHSRGAFRVYVEGDDGLTLEIDYQGQVLPDVRIINLSADGLKLSFAEEMSTELENISALNNCIIRLPNGVDIDCDIQLRNIYRIRTPHPHTLAGGKLIIEQAQHRVKLQQYLASVQRVQRRRETRIV